ncbi:frizzled-3-like isoform X1 [Scleropages formosus]|uniref:Frizzled-3 n=2 Tax=Scleropages formosus TaxID=113540 RepID=A0A8C9S688_SCLFO|nr:frizzled-3-like isoform X1 [Scleropages formosus]XP_018589725.1 frizzled-3-like isoform X1 [Scleropages formosus]
MVLRPARSKPGCSAPAPLPQCSAGMAALLWMVLSVLPVGGTIHVDSAESHSAFACEPIALRMCQDLPYNTTFMPNLLNHYDQQTAALAMEPFHPMVNLQCSPDLRPFLCALHAPVCTEYGRVSLPCRSLCLQAQHDCQKLMDMFGVAWPEEMDCNRFPDCHESYPRAVDLIASTEPTDQSSLTVQRDYGFWCPRELKMEPELSYSFLGVRDCSPPCPNMYFRHDELNFARYFIGVVSIVCLSATLFTFLTFLIDVTRFRYPERPIIFYAVCYMMVSLVFFLGFLLGDRVACNAASPGQYRASTVTQGSHNKACTLLFMGLYFFTMAGSVWWVILTITWFLAAVPKWGSEAIEKKALLFHASAWGVPGALTVTLLAMNKIEGDNVSGVCFVGLYDVAALRWFLLAPLCLDVLVGVVLLLAGIVALNRVRMEIPLEKENQDKLVKFMIRIGVFSVLYLVPLLVVIGCYFYEQSYRSVWETTWVQERCREYHIPCPYQVEQTSRPDLVLFLMKYLMVLVVGIPSVFWVGSKKTCFEWASFLHGRRRKDSGVNESRQVLQEPDFAQSLLRDPNAPIIRKSRGTSTQGTSTHASSTHLAMMDEQRSKAGSVHSKMSSYHGSLHRSRDGGYTPCSYRGTEERPTHGSLPRLNEQSQHSSMQRLDSQSRHSSVRDLSNVSPALITHGTSMNRVIEEDGASA